MDAPARLTKTAARRLPILLALIVAVLVLETALAGSAGAGVAWTPITPGYDKYYLGVDFLDAQRGWVVGENQVILRTDDGGATWTQQHLDPVNYALHAVQMWSDTRGWAVGNGGATSGSGSAILATTDGRTWSPQPEPAFIGVLMDLCFVSAGEGWAVGMGSHIIHTTSGGSSWTVSGISAAAVWMALAATSARLGVRKSACSRRRRARRPSETTRWPFWTSLSQSSKWLAAPA